MDTAYTTAGSINGIGIVLWVAFLYFVPRFLKWQPRRLASQTRQPTPQAHPHSTPKLLDDKANLRIA